MTQSSDRLDRIEAHLEAVAATMQLLAQSSQESRADNAELKKQIKALGVVVEENNRQIGRLTESMHMQRSDITDMKADLREIKDITKQQAEIANTQAQSIQTLLQMLNRQQA